MRRTVDHPRIIRLFAGTTNAYLLAADRGWLLMDTGYARDERRFMRALARHAVRLEDIAYLLLTHHHDDHAGLVDRLTRLSPAIRVIVHERSVPLLAGGANDLSQGGYWINRWVWLLAGIKRRVTPAWDFRFPPYRVRATDIVLSGGRDETTLRSLGVPGVVIATPGHTADSISVLLDSGDAFVGDAAASFLRFAQTRHCVVFITDLDEHYRSWQRLIDAGARTIHPAHGRAFGVEALRRDMYRNTRAGLVPFAVR